MPNNRASKDVREKKIIELQKEINESTIIVEDINTSLSEMDRFDR